MLKFEVQMDNTPIWKYPYYMSLKFCALVFRNPDSDFVFVINHDFSYSVGILVSLYWAFLY